MNLAFLLTNPYQVYHYKWIAAHVPDATVVIEVREQDFGLTAEYVRQHMPDCAIEWVSNTELASLDGRFDAIVCQTPILPHQFLKRTLVVAQQYSLAKERYQYGVWRSHASLNLMYGEYSVDKVRGFCNAVAVGNPLFDSYFGQETPQRHSLAGGLDGRRLLYLPTYGSLSSVESTLTPLRDLGVSVTIKLHHMDESLDAALPDHIRAVDSTADPAELLRTHDGVISDYSGAAFDALYARLPIVVTGELDPNGKDYRRLSEAEINRALLGRFAMSWNPGDDLTEAFSRAEEKIGTDDYRQLIERHFTNPGGAGAACAREIERLITEGAPEHFAAQQVRTAAERYIVRNRELQAGISAGAAKSVPTPAKEGSTGVAPRGLYHRARRHAARSDRLRKIVRVVRGTDKAPDWQTQRRDVVPRPEPTPAARREAVATALLPHLKRAGVVAARDHTDPGSDVAVLDSSKRQLHAALKALAKDEPGLKVRVGVDWRVVESMPVVDLPFYDLFNAHWLEIGSPREAGPYKIGAAGYLNVLFVKEDPERNRYLAARLGANRVDWTPLFSAPTRTSTRDGIVATGTKHPHISAPIDIVYTWVDSNDPAWRESHGRFSEGHEAHNVSANNDERYLDREELRYSLRSLWMFAPFVRNIYVVTAGQRPNWLDEDDDRVKVVSHQDIFPDPSALPTFNSHSIEACLHRVPGISEYFLYFNDDFFLGREVTEEDFFTAQGQAKVRFSPSQYIYQGKPEVSAIPTDWAAYNSVNIIERDFGTSFDRRLKHLAYPLRKSVLEELDDRYTDEFERTRAARFRSITDVAVPSMFAQYYAIATGRAVAWPNIKQEYVYLDTGRLNSVDRYKQILNRRPTYFCLNATRYSEIDLATQAQHVREFLSSVFPYPAPWER